MLKMFKKFNDYASVAERNKIGDITIPVITLSKYPEIVTRTSDLLTKVAEELSKETGGPIEDILKNMNIASLLQYIPLIIKIAADEFFDFMAFLLDIEKERIEKLSLIDLIKIINKMYEINEFAEVQEEIENFTKALNKRQGEKK